MQIMILMLRRRFWSLFSQEFTFCEKVKARLCNHNDFQALLKCLHINNTED
ncbi:putative paired amphipathic helix superfamily protein [Helianthus annuus]|nr:putative paired amphipathic helix superfamily protein [Helianthus annuus]